MPDLPQEIFDYIMDFVDKDTLRACSLAASRLRARGQQRLFRTLRVPRERPQRAASKRKALAAVFVQSPHLPLHVRDLTLDLGMEETDCPALDIILSSVKNLSAFALNGQYTDWTGIGTGLTRRVADLLRLSSLEQARWKLLVCVPLVIAELLLALPIVSLDIVHISRSSRTQAASPSSRLRDLSFVRDGGSISSFLLSNPHFLRPMRRMEIRTEEYDDQRTLLESCAETLETLAIVIWTSSSPVVHISSLPLVRYVEITAFFTGNPVLPPNIFAITDSLAVFPSLTSICLTFKLHMANPTTEVSDRRWSFPPIPAFSVPFSSTHFPKLGSIRCRLVTYSGQLGCYLAPSDRVVSDFRAAVKHSMPGPYAAGIVNISISCPRNKR
ncbi:hypothetical protein MKEN_00454500 [Mycena kentingensis (nom. inval.)]|nr:hypothetical protein MKEN_00454500 [Mycena kentingensis (nom. inval.)]